MKSALRRANRYLLQATDGIAGLIVLLLMLGITAAVVLRLFGVAVTGVIELSGLSLIYLTFLAAPHVTARDDNVKLELIDPLLSRRGLNIADTASTLLQIAVMAVLLWASADLMLTDIERGTAIGGDLRLPRWMVGIVVPIGSALILVQLVRRLVELVTGHREEAMPHERDHTPRDPGL